MAARAAAGLLRLAEQHGRVVKSGTLIDLKLSQRDLGNYLGLSRENVSRQLGLFRDVGHLRIEGSEIVILDTEGLRRYSDEPA
jgi:CRP-like cAMP-binding protein